jgi:HAD superfamily hydrolase (TIGR01450 family)
MRPVASTLRGSSKPLAEMHDVALLDLDGVVYVGAHAVPSAPQALTAVREAGMRIAFVTNNAARPPAAVAEHLTELGIAARPAEVVNSAQAAARYLADLLEPGARVLVVGTTGLVEALSERGLTPVAEATADVAAVVQGFSPEMSWRQLSEGAVAIRAGVPWVATNLDATVPSPRGPLPGNGSLVAALRHATRREPTAVTGKPDPTMHREMVDRTGAQRPLIVGDRLDTDIEGANAVDCPSLLVLTGVTTPRLALCAPPAQRPTYLGYDLTALLDAHPAPSLTNAIARCGCWEAAANGDQVTLERNGGGPPDREGTRESQAAGALTDDDLDAWRALCAAWWAQSADRAAEPTVSARDDAARECLGRLGLA